MYELITGSELNDLKLVKWIYLTKDEAIKELLYKVKDYNDIAKEINHTTGYEYHSLLKKVEPREGENVRYENEIDYMFVKRRS